MTVPHAVLLLLTVCSESRYLLTQTGFGSGAQQSGVRPPTKQGIDHAAHVGIRQGGQLHDELLAGSGGFGFPVARGGAGRCALLR